jgi:hypothetical protein
MSGTGLKGSAATLTVVGEQSNEKESKKGNVFIFMLDFFVL